MAVLAGNTFAVVVVALVVVQLVVAAFGDTDQRWHKHEDRKKYAEAEWVLAETVFRRNTGLSASLNQRNRLMIYCKFVKVVASPSQQPPQQLQRSRKSVVAQLAVAGA